MKTRILIFLPIALFVFAAAGTLDLQSLFDYDGQAVPSYVTTAVNGNNADDNTPNDNTMSDMGATLGRVLFYDKNLSLNKTVSCSSCHHQEFAFGDTSTVSVGFDGNVTGRHSTRIVNARYGDEDNFFWDERASSLEEQATQPIRNEVEMGFSGTNGQPTFDSLISRMDDIFYYNELFQQVYGDQTITEDRIQKAIAQFVRSITSFDSRYDIGLAAAGDNLNANFSNFTTSENNGKDLYMSNNGANCDNCHRAPLFDIRRNTNNNGVITVAGNPSATDITNTRSPSLRDMIDPSGTLNGPMMHDGSMTTMRQMIDHYDNPPFNNNIDNRLRNNDNTQSQDLNLSETEKDDLEAFLKTLTGVNLYTDEKWSDPFDDSGFLTLIDKDCMTATMEISNDIVATGYTATVNDSINANNAISQTGVLSLAATNSITLSAGFEVEVGSLFTAEIESCN